MSGFDQVASGLLGSINTNIERKQAQANKDANEGDMSLWNSMQETKKLDEQQQAKANETGSQIEAMAPTLRYDNDQSNEAKFASMIVSKDRINSGHEDPKYDPWAQKAYDLTKADIIKNPSKYQIQPSQPQHVDASNVDPNELRTAQKFDKNMTAQQIADSKAGVINRPYSNYPSGVFPNMSDFENQQAASKATAAIPADVAKQSALENARSSSMQNEQDKLDNQFGFSGGKDQGIIGSQPAAQSHNNSSLDVNASDLSPTPGGIHLSGPAPSDAGQPQDVRQVSNFKDYLPAQTKSQFAGVNNDAFIKASIDKDGNVVPQQGLDWIKNNNIHAGNQVEMLLRGDENLSTTAMQRNSTDAYGNPKPNAWQSAAEMAHVLDPSWSMSKFASMQKLRNEYQGNGYTAQTIKNGNAVLQHLSDLQDAAGAINTGNIQQINKIANKFGSETGATPIVAYQNIAKRVGEELAATYRPRGGTDTEMAEQAAQWASKLSNPQKLETIGDQTTLLSQKLNTFQEEWNHNMGEWAKNDIEFYQPETLKALQNLKTSTAPAQATLAQGRANNQANTQQQGQATPPDNAPVFKSLAEVPPNVQHFKDTQGNTRLNPNYKAQ